MIRFLKSILLFGLCAGSCIAFGAEKKTLYYQIVQNKRSYDVKVDISHEGDEISAIHLQARLSPPPRLLREALDFTTNALPAAERIGRPKPIVMSSPNWITVKRLIVPEVGLRELQLPAGGQLRNANGYLIPARNLPFDSSNALEKTLYTTGLFLIRAKGLDTLIANIPLTVEFNFRSSTFMTEPPLRERAERRIFASHLGSFSELYKNFGTGHGPDGVIISVVDFMEDGRVFTNGTGFVIDGAYRRLTTDVAWLVEPTALWKVVPAKAGATLSIQYGQETWHVRLYSQATPFFNTNIQLSPDSAKKIAKLVVPESPSLAPKPMIQKSTAETTLTKFAPEERIDIDLARIETKRMVGAELSSTEVDGVLSVLKENPSIAVENYPALVARRKRALGLLEGLLRGDGSSTSQPTANLSRNDLIRIHQAMKAFAQDQSSAETAFMNRLPTESRGLRRFAADAVRNFEKRQAAPARCELLFQ